MTTLQQYLQQASFDTGGWAEVRALNRGLIPPCPQYVGIVGDEYACRQLIHDAVDKITQTIYNCVRNTSPTEPDATQTLDDTKKVLVDIVNFSYTNNGGMFSFHWPHVPYVEPSN